MHTSPLSDSTSASLRTALPAARNRPIETLALAMVGVVVRGSSAMGRIAHGMPLSTTQEAKEQRRERLVTHVRITPDIPFEPVVRSARHGLRGQRVSRIIDRVLLRYGQHVLVVSAAFRRCSIPLSWMVLSHTGSRGLADQQQVFTTALALLPERVHITVHGASEFRRQALYPWLRAYGGDVMVSRVARSWPTRRPPPPSR